jgi:hypothetical protein
MDPPGRVCQRCRLRKLGGCSIIVTAMHKFVLVLAAALLVGRSFGQGQVVFGNLGGGINAPVICGDTGHGPGPDYSVQLFRQLGATLTPLLPISTFRAAGSGAEAIADRYWETKTVDVPGVMPGDPGVFVVRAWLTAFGSYDAAVAAGLGSGYGVSGPVTVNLGGGMQPPANLIGLQGFTLGWVCIPEPSLLAISALGVVILLFCALRQGSCSMRSGVKPHCKAASRT